MEICFWAGLERYFQEGFRLGDPRAYLHGPGHPHHAAPQFTGCEGCCPPVHGTVLCLANIGGEVKTLRSHPAEASVMGLAEGSGSAAADLTFAGDGGDEGVSESSTQGAWEKVTPNPNSNPDPDPDPDPN